MYVSKGNVWSARITNGVSSVSFGSGFGGGTLRLFSDKAVEREQLKLK